MIKFNAINTEHFSIGLVRDFWQNSRFEIKAGIERNITDIIVKTFLAENASSILGLSPTLKRIRAIGKSPNGAANASLMKPCTKCASPSRGPLPGRINSSACCCALRPNRVVILASNSSPSPSSISERFIKAETCNQFGMNVKGAYTEIHGAGLVSHAT